LGSEEVWRRNPNPQSQATLAEFFAEEAKLTSGSHVSDYERGIRWPTGKVLIRLALALDVEVFEFFKFDGLDRETINKSIVDSKMASLESQAVELLKRAESLRREIGKFRRASTDQ